MRVGFDMVIIEPVQLMETLLQDIPEAAYGLLAALVGAGIALAGVGLQLLVTARQRRLDREHELRREVYLEAAEGIAVGTELLASFANLEVSIQDLAARAREKQGWANKLAIVASLQTITALNKAAEHMFSRLMDLMRARVDLDLERSHTTELRQEAARLNDYHQRFIAALQATPTMAQSLAEAFGEEYVANHLGDTRSKSERLFAEAVHHQEIANQQHFHLLVSSLSAALEYQRLVVDANIEVRRELNLPIDVAKYKELVDQSSERLLEKLRTTLDPAQFTEESQHGQQSN